MKFTVVRFLKSLFIQLRLHVLFSPFTGGLLNLAYMTRLSKWVRGNKKIAFNDFYSKWNYDKRYDLYQYVLERENLRAPVNYLEFGVAGGVSFDWWMTENTHPDSRFYGFDTFTGLPEDFGPYKKGTFNTSHQVPDILDIRGKFYQGMFQQTLPGFLSNLNTNKRKI